MIRKTNSSYSRSPSCINICIFIYLEEKNLILILYSFKTNIVSTPHLIQTISTISIAFLGIVITFAFFRKNQKYLSTSNYLGRILQYIGRRTLDIYLLHYFFMSYIPHLNDYFSNSNPNLLIDCCAIILAFIIIGCCLITSNTIRLSDFLGYWLFGVKKMK